MNTQQRRSFTANKGLIFVSTLVTSMAAPGAHAQMVLDGTLGFRGALDGPNYQIGAKLGQQHGGNLFHSFSDFNINTGESATFSGPNSVQNIISRVTGGNISRINGLLRSKIPGADFYFLNPYGILFGEGAQLDVQGSFHASTADTLRLSDGGEFNAREPSQSLLTVAPISAFGFLTDAPAAITVQDTKLSVPERETLSLIGGDLRMDGDEVPIYDDEGKPSLKIGLSASFGRINLASVASRAEVIPTETGLNLSENAQGGLLTANNTIMNTSGEGGGAIYIRAGQFVLDNSVVEANTVGIENGKIIDIRAGQVQLNNSVIGSETTGTGNAGLINIEAGQLNITDGTQIASQTFGVGQGGDIHIKIAGTITLSDSRNAGSLALIGAISNSQLSNAGDAGHIIIEARQVHIADGTQITTSIYGGAQGGNIRIKATDNIILSGERSENLNSSINTATESNTNNAGNAGAIVLEANELRLEEGSIIFSLTTGYHQSGDIKIQITDRITLSGEGSRGFGSSIASITVGTDEQTGNSSTIEINADKIHLSNGAQVSVSSFGTGQGANTYITADSVVLSGTSTFGHPSGIFSKSNYNSDNAGDGGSIVLEAREINIADNAQISTGTEGGGEGGYVELRTHALHMNTGGVISASSKGQGQAGNLSLHVEDMLRMTNGFIETATAHANGGNIDIISSGYLYLIKSAINTGVFAEKGDGGNITLTPKFIVLDNSKIIAQAYEGRGGNIDITTAGIYNNTAQGRFESPRRRSIDALSQLGIDGIVTINTPYIDPLQGLLTLPAGFLDASKLFKEGCTPRTIGNTFLNKGHHKVAANNLMDTRWASFYFDSDTPSPTVMEKRLAKNLLGEQVSLTKPLFGCGQGDNLGRIAKKSVHNA